MKKDLGRVESVGVVEFEALLGSLLLESEFESDMSSSSISASAANADEAAG